MAEIVRKQQPSAQYLIVRWPLFGYVAEMKKSGFGGNNVTPVLRYLRKGMVLVIETNPKTGEPVFTEYASLEAMQADFKEPDMLVSMTSLHVTYTED